jgi:ATP-binding cassette, subfamily B, bacterial MsbA
MKIYLRILAYSKKYGWYILLNLIFTVLAVVFAGIAFPLLQPVIDLLFGGDEMINTAEKPDFSFSIAYLRDMVNYLVVEIVQADGRLQALTWVVAFIIAVSLMGNVFLYISSVFMTLVRTKTIEDIRQELFNHMIFLPVGWFEGEKKGDIMTRITSDVNEIEKSVVTTFESIFRDPFTILFYILLMLMISAELTLFVFIVLPLMAVLVSYIGRSLKKDAYNAQGKFAEMMSLLEETLSGMRVVKAFGGENYIKNIFRKYSDYYGLLSRKQYYKKKLVPPLSEVAGIITVALILWFGGRLVFDGQLEASAFMVFIFLFVRIVKPAKNFSGAFSNIYKGIASGERIFRLMDTKSNIHSREGALPLKALKDGVSLENVSFSYGENVALQEINFSVPCGKTVALVGPSGSGKSTLAELLLRFYDPSSGRILLDGKDLRDYNIKDLRNMYGLVSQEPILFNDTIFNNIAFGRSDKSSEEVMAAAKAANAHAFIMKQPQGYDTNIGDGGRLLSGGQRQRISIARALLRNPDFLILDEATSSLDSTSEKVVQDALYRLMQGRTCLIIAHRLSTIKDADLVVVLDNGKIVQEGPHEVLLQEKGLYRELYEGR